jgi:hypothetical protein
MPEQQQDNQNLDSLLGSMTDGNQSYKTDINPWNDETSKTSEHSRIVEHDIHYDMGQTIPLHSNGYSILKFM